jgi:hypothetical protein
MYASSLAPFQLLERLSKNDKIVIGRCIKAAAENFLG